MTEDFKPLHRVEMFVDEFIHGYENKAVFDDKNVNWFFDILQDGLIYGLAHWVKAKRRPSIHYIKPGDFILFADKTAYMPDDIPISEWHKQDAKADDIYFMGLAKVVSRNSSMTASGFYRTVYGVEVVVEVEVKLTNATKEYSLEKSFHDMSFTHKFGGYTYGIEEERIVGVVAASNSNFVRSRSIYNGGGMGGYPYFISKVRDLGSMLHPGRVRVNSYDVTDLVHFIQHNNVNICYDDVAYHASGRPGFNYAAIPSFPSKVSGNRKHIKRVKRWLQQNGNRLGALHTKWMAIDD